MLTSKEAKNLRLSIKNKKLSKVKVAIEHEIERWARGEINDIIVSKNITVLTLYEIYVLSREFAMNGWKLEYTYNQGEGEFIKVSILPGYN